MAWRVIQAAGSVIEWWKKLDDGSKKFLMTIGAILIAWRLLNAAFLKSPIGLITTLILAIGLLYDDYQTWKEGGKSLIDWSKWQPEIEQAKKVFKWLRDKFLELKDNLGGWKNTLTILFGFLAGAKLVSMLTGIGRLVAGFMGLGKAIGGSIGGLGKLAQGIAQLAIKNPWLLMFIPANNTPTTSEEMASIGGIGSNIVPERQQAYEALRKENPGKDFFTDEQIQRKIQEMGLEPEQRAQSVKRPQALEHAGTIAELVNNYARKSDQASNQYLISTLSREMGMAVDSKLLPSDMRDLLKVLRSIAQNTNQPGSESATEIISSPQVINAEQLMPRPQASAQVPDYVDTIAKLVNNYAKNAGRADNRALIAELTRITGKSDDSKLLSSDMQDILKVLRDIAQNINQPGSESAAELLLPRPVITTEQPTQRPQASAQGKVLLNWMQPMFSKLESLYRLPEGLLKSVAITESGGNQFAMSGAGAKGLFQFMDGTARDMGLRGNDVFDPMKSAEAAAKYLNQLLKQNGGDLSKTLASYNWGIGNVQRYGMGLMPQETRNYIPKVMSNMPTSAPVIQQETNINIHGVSDPREAARLTVDRQKGVNSQLTQQLPAGPR
nr:lytic transglycosylase domain-containing protein [Enterobacter sp. 170250]